MRNETCFAKRHVTDGSMNCYYGLVIDVLAKIQQELGFKVFVTSEDKYGTLLTNTSSYAWTGATNRLNYLQFQENVSRLEQYAVEYRKVGGF